MPQVAEHQVVPKLADGAELFQGAVKRATQMHTVTVGWLQRVELVCQL